MTSFKQFLETFAIILICIVASVCDTSTNQTEIQKVKSLREQAKKAMEVGKTAANFIEKVGAMMEEKKFWTNDKFLHKLGGRMGSVLGAIGPAFSIISLVLELTKEEKDPNAEIKEAIKEAVQEIKEEIGNLSIRMDLRFDSLERKLQETENALKAELIQANYMEKRVNYKLLTKAYNLYRTIPNVHYLEDLTKVCGTYIAETMLNWQWTYLVEDKIQYGFLMKVIIGYKYHRGKFEHLMDVLIDDATSAALIEQVCKGLTHKKKTTDKELKEALEGYANETRKTYKEITDKIFEAKKYLLDKWNTEQLEKDIREVFDKNKNANKQQMSVILHNFLADKYYWVKWAVNVAHEKDFGDYNHNYPSPMQRNIYFHVLIVNRGLAMVQWVSSDMPCTRDRYTTEWDYIWKGWETTYNQNDYYYGERAYAVETRVRAELKSRFLNYDSIVVTKRNEEWEQLGRSITGGYFVTLNFWSTTYEEYCEPDTPSHCGRIMCWGPIPGKCGQTRNYRKFEIYVTIALSCPKYD